MFGNRRKSLEIFWKCLEICGALITRVNEDLDVLVNFEENFLARGKSIAEICAQFL